MARDALPSVGVIGAGVAGLACARALAAEGCATAVFDESRSPGGRVSTRRAGRFAFDHGAQYLTVSEPAFQDEVARLEAAGAVARWRPRLARLRHGRRLEVPRELAERGRWVATPRMSALGRALAAGLDVRLRTRVEALRRRGDGWLVIAADGSELARFDAVALAVPAPDAVPLLGDAPSLRTDVARVQLAPCQAVLAAFGAPLALDFDAAWIEDSPLAWVARNASKPRRPAAETWVLHGSAEWSAARVEEPARTVAPALLEAFAEAVGSALPEPVRRAAYCWRHALPARSLEARLLFDPSRGIGLCGDWCGGARIEAAWRSGRALAARLLQRFRAEER